MDGTCMFAVKLPSSLMDLIGRLAYETDADHDQVVRTFALMGMRMWAQTNGQPDVAAFCHATLQAEAPGPIDVVFMRRVT